MSRSSCANAALEGFDEKILALYSRGLSTRDIERYLRELYGVNVGRELISRVTDAVMDDARAWQQRPLDDVYPVVFLDAFVLKVKEGGSVQRKACYLALGVRTGGERDVLGMWFQQTEGAKFWMQVLGELKQRGVQDILICCVDGLTGFPSNRGDLPKHDRPNLHRSPHPTEPALRPASRVRPGRQGPQADLHRDRRGRRLAGAGDLRREVGQAIPANRPGLAGRLGARHPLHGLRARGPPVIYTTNAIEALNRQLRKAIKTKGHFPTEDSARKLIYLAILNAVPQWTRTRAWTKALLAFKIQFGYRLPDSAI